MAAFGFTGNSKIKSSAKISKLRYLYKRLRFLGNKVLSQACTLIFLAVWHGFYSGYYINFLLEFLTIYAEKQ
ncbi:Lysophosphatidylcholine acyltransferase 3, partial [Hymenolepis weldensis]